MIRPLIWLVRAVLIPLAVVALWLLPRSDWGAPLVLGLAGICILWAAAESVAIFWRYLWLQPRRARRGLCRHCGYDLKGVPLEKPWKCPECGRLRC